MTLKKIALIFMGTALLLLAGLILFIKTYDFSPHIDQANQWVHDRIGRKVSINGDVSLKIGLTPRLWVTDVSITNNSQTVDPETITIGKLVIELDLRALFKKTVRVKQLRIENGVLFYGAATPDSPPVLMVTRLTANADSFESPIHVNLKGRYDLFNMNLAGTIGTINQLVKGNVNYPFNLSGTINETAADINGQFTGGFSATPLSIDLSLYSDHVDTRRLMPADPDKQSHDDEEKRKTLFSTDEIPLAFLDSIHLNADISIDRLLISDTSLNSVTAKAELKKGRFSIDPFRFSLFNGDFSGNVSITRKKHSPEFKSAVTLTGLDSQLLSDKLKGKIDGRFDLSGRGKSIAQIMAGLNGPLWASMEDGTIEAGFIQSLGMDVVTGVLGFLNPLDEKEASNRLNCAALRLTFNKGIGNINVLLTDTPLIAATAKGTVNLNDETLDILVHPSPKKGIGTEGLGKLNLSISQLARTFQVKGTLMEPDIDMDELETAKTIVKTTGGVLLFGPVGLITAFTGTGSSDPNPCPCALAVAQTGSDDACKTDPATQSKSSNQSEEKGKNPIKKLLNIFE